MPWLYIGLCGGVWGAGLARTLALEWLTAPDGRAFFFGAVGVGVLSLLSAAVLIAVSRQLSAFSSDTAAWDIAKRCIPLLLPAMDVFSGMFQPWRGPVLLVGGLALTLLNMWRGPAAHRLSPRAGFVIAVTLPLLVYLLNLSPYVGVADTFEFQVTALRLGIAHPTGYPLYVLLGKLFTPLPFGTLAWKVNLTAAVCAAAAMGVVYLLVHRLTRHTLVAVLTTLALAWSSAVWSQAIIAEVYALNLLFVAGALWFALDILEGRAMPATLWRAALLMGLSLTNHITMVMLIPALGLTCMLRWPRLRETACSLGDWLKAAALFALGLAVYAYIPLRWPAIHEGQWMGFGEFLAYITGQQFGGALQLGLLRDPTRYAILWRLLREPFGVVGLALAAIGLLYLAIKRWRLALVSLAAFLPYCFYALVYLVPDIDVFIIPAHLILVLWIGVGAARITSCELRVANRELRITTNRVLITLFALLPLSLLWRNQPLQNMRAEGEADEAWGHYTLSQPLAPDAAILADSEKFPPLYYLQQAEGLRPDLDLVMLFDEAQYREAMESRLSQGQHVYLARYLPGLDAYGVSAVGPLVEVAPSAPATRTATLLARFGDALAMHSFHLEADPEGRPLHHLTLLWQTEAPVGEDLEVRIRLMSAAQMIWERPATRPVGGYTTTQAWPSGVVIADYHPLQWPTWLSPGDYTVEVGLFPRFEQTGLPVDGTEAIWYPLTRVSLPADVNQALPQRDYALFDDGLWLTGADFPGEGYANRPLTLDLTWQRGKTVPQAMPEIRWIEAAGQSVPTSTSPGPGSDPATWSSGETRTVRYTVVTPSEPGRYRLAVSRQPSAVSQSMPRCGWMERRRDDCVLGEVNVLPSNAELANFGNQVTLLDATLDASALPAGGQLHVDLRWRGLRAWAHNYTVFVQVVGPDGQLYGQADSWPVQGARPTSGWAAGEEIADPYRLYLKENAPPGEYTVIVGWYLLADMSRLPLVDANRQTIGDFYRVGSFTIGE
ncbi:MAG: DUF2723 domain-containing protein [Anaerolineae bacterium]|nr:DUF2723 domain-containing protein [Anaerolineae bacterium]